jgi:hypothetical protein
MTVLLNVAKIGSFSTGEGWGRAARFDIFSSSISFLPRLGF